MRMARVNVYLPDDLAAEARSAGLNLSRVMQEALRREMSRKGLHAWLEAVGRLAPIEISPEAVAAAVEGGREDLGLND
jgi:post-segregation antitoxin (ccd killing protein)